MAFITTPWWMHPIGFVDEDTQKKWHEEWVADGNEPYKCAYSHDKFMEWCVQNRNGKEKNDEAIARLNSFLKAKATIKPEFVGLIDPDRMAEDFFKISA